MKDSTVAGVLEAWGRLTALSVLDGQTMRDAFLSELGAKANADAWQGAIAVWVANAHNHEHAAGCLACLQFATCHSMARTPLLNHVGRLFRPKPPLVRVPLELFRAVYVSDGDGAMAVSNTSPLLGEWLCLLVENQPDEALEIAAITASLGTARGISPFHDADVVGTLLTSLFREAEERERSDRGDMLARVVALQDTLLSMPTSDLSAWLHAAERPEV